MDSSRVDVPRACSVSDLLGLKYCTGIISVSNLILVPCTVVDQYRDTKLDTAIEVKCQLRTSQQKKINYVCFFLVHTDDSCLLFFCPFLCCLKPLDK